MKINGIQNQYQNMKQYKVKENIKNEDLKKDESVKIEISKSAKELAEKVNENKSVNYSERVEKIRKAIVDESYKIDSEKIADKIIEKIRTQKGSED